MTTTPLHHHDVIVVGARCAGSATARLLAQRGHDVAVLERATFPSDTLSTHAIARSGVVQLARWGLLGKVLAAGTPPIREVRFHRPEGMMARTIKDRAGVDCLVAPRRHVLDSLLVEAAAAAGATVRTGVTVEGVVRHGDGRVAGVTARAVDGGTFELRARFVVGADGLRSRIARAVEAPMHVAEASTGATHYAYYRGDWSPMEYYLGDRGFAGIFPTNDGEACIWVCSPSDETERLRRATGTAVDTFDTLVRRTAPELARRLHAAERTSAVHGVLRLPNHVRHPVGSGWALVGDAGYHRDAITGHGISDAFRDAELLALALDAALRGSVDEGNALEGYRRQRDELLAEIFALTVALARFPDAETFVRLQKQLGQAIDTQAATLTAWPGTAPVELAA
jgi:flavin-dependent dehydrogenase